MDPITGWRTAWQDPVWVTNRACAGIPVKMFEPVSGRYGAYRKAQRVCAGCPVQELCAKYYVGDNSDLYVGGMTPIERKLRRQAFAQAAS